mmetsp:Transcript_30058/g.70141  ORF Transcript_30058/g.70141 Transcript_30058/m.70141 type:complete len:293 (-) Transcript_30058:109-987(-)
MLLGFVPSHGHQRLLIGSLPPRAKDLTQNFLGRQIIHGIVPWGLIGCQQQGRSGIRLNVVVLVVHLNRRHGFRQSSRIGQFVLVLIASGKGKELVPGGQRHRSQSQFVIVGATAVVSGHGTAASPTGESQAAAAHGRAARRDRGQRKVFRVQFFLSNVRGRNQHGALRMGRRHAASVPRDGRQVFVKDVAAAIDLVLVQKSRHQGGSHARNRNLARGGRMAFRFFFSFFIRLLWNTGSRFVVLAFLIVVHASNDIFLGMFAAIAIVVVFDFKLVHDETSIVLLLYLIGERCV